MSYFIDICLICLEHTKNLILISSQDTNGTSIRDKINYFLPEHALCSNIPKYICAECKNNLNRIYELQPKCSQNLAIYEKYVQQITSKNSSYKYLSVIIRPNFVYKEADMAVDNNCNKDVSDSQTEIGVDTVDYKEVFVKKPNKELVLYDEIELLLHKIKGEYSKPDDMNTNMIARNLQILDNSDSVSFSTGKENISEPAQKGLHTCHVCHKKFSMKVKLKSHIRSHGVISYKCGNNDEKTRKCRNLRQNVIKYYDENWYECNRCDKSFKSLKYLKRHQFIHTNSKKYTCEICKRSFKFLYILKQHKHLHSSEERFNCNVCNKSFKQLTGLTRHQFLHTGEKTFTCGICQKSFARLKYLNQHNILHTDEKPFHCKICKKSFRRLAHLQQHNPTHKTSKKNRRK